VLVDVLAAGAGAAGGAAAAVAASRAAPGLLARRANASAILIVVLAAGFAAFAPSAPTGLAPADALLRVAFVALTSAAAARSRRGALLVAAAAAGVCAGPAPGIVFAFTALGVALTIVRLGRSRPLGALAGGLLGHALLRLEWPEAHGATAAVAALALAVIGVSAMGRVRRRSRRRLLLAGAAAGAAAVVCSAGFAVAVLLNRDALEEAVRNADAAIAAMRRGDTPEAASQLERAAAALAASRGDLNAWWARPALAVPVVAHQARAMEALVSSALEVVVTGAQVATEADYERVRPRDGRIDVAAVAALATPLEATLRSLDEALALTGAARSPWLLDPLGSRIDQLRTRSTDARADTVVALDAVANAPRLLGADGPRRWLLALTTPAELRGLGGFLGSWGILTTDEGLFELSVVEPIRTLAAQGPFDLQVSPDYDARHLERWQPARFPQNVTSSPDLASAAVAMRQIVDQAGHGPIDGVIVIDPIAIAGLIRLTGPIAVDWWPEPLTADNTAGILLTEQYRQAQDPERRDFLEDVARSVFDRISDGALPQPGTIADVLGPLLTTKHLRLHAFDLEGGAYLERIGSSNRMVTAAWDGFGFVSADTTPSKLNAFLHRSVTYDVTVDPATGRVDAIAEVRLRNDAPTDLPDNGYFGEPAGRSRLASALYTTLELQWAGRGSEAIGVAIATERGYNVYETNVVLAPGEEAVLRYGLAGTVPARPVYRLDVHRQPTVHADQLTVRVNGQTIFDGRHDRDLVLEAGL